MSNWYGADADSFGERFFSRSLLRSGYFLVSCLLFLAVVLTSVWQLLIFWRSLRPDIAFLLFIVVMRSFNSLTGAVMRHRALRSACLPHETGSDCQKKAALGVAAKAILDDLFYTFSTLLLILLIVSRLLHHIMPGTL